MPRKILVNLSNSIGTFVQKTNAMSDYMGDLDDLNPQIRLANSDSNLVSAINFLDSAVATLGDSANFSFMQVDSATITFLTVDSAVITTLTADSAYITYAQINSADINHLTVDSGAVINGGLLVDSINTTKITVTGDSTSVILPYGSIDGNEIHDSSIQSRHFDQLVTTLILDSAGVTLKTLFTPGS